MLEGTNNQTHDSFLLKRGLEDAEVKPLGRVRHDHDEEVAANIQHHETSKHSRTTHKHSTKTESSVRTAQRMYTPIHMPVFRSPPASLAATQNLIQRPASCLSA